MARTGFAMILYFPIRLTSIPCQKCFEIFEDMMQNMLMLNVLFTWILRLKICSAGLLPVLSPACSLTISSACSLGKFKMTYSITNEDNGSVVLAEL